MTIERAPLHFGGTSGMGRLEIVAPGASQEVELFFQAPRQRCKIDVIGAAQRCSGRAFDLRRNQIPGGMEEEERKRKPGPVPIRCRQLQTVAAITYRPAKAVQTTGATSHLVSNISVR